MDTNEKVIIVNERDEWLGTMGKLEAHTTGALHRALSVFILNDKDEILLQQRADGKYHSAGLWSNTCCSHPRPGESTQSAAERRLAEEMGFVVPVFPMFTFRYNSAVGPNMVENEYDHVFIGRHNGIPCPNAAEVKGYRYIPIPELEQWIKSDPAAFTPWLRLLLPEFLERFRQKNVAA